jgi:hypothetical protein
MTAAFDHADREAAIVVILEDVAAGVAIRKALTGRMGKRIFYGLIATDEKLRERYAAAKLEAAEAIADECIQLADSCKPTRDHAAKARLQIDTRKWHLAHLLPRKYGERTVLAGDPDNPLAFVDADAATVRSKLLSGVAAAGATAAPGDAKQ